MLFTLNNLVNVKTAWKNDFSAYKRYHLDPCFMDSIHLEMPDILICYLTLVALARIFVALKLTRRRRISCCTLCLCFVVDGQKLLVSMGSTYLPLTVAPHLIEPLTAVHIQLTL